MTVFKMPLPPAALTATQGSTKQQKLFSCQSEQTDSCLSKQSDNLQRAACGRKGENLMLSLSSLSAKCTFVLPDFSIE